MTFADTADAVAASTEMIDSKMGKSLKKFLTKNIIKKELKDKVRVGSLFERLNRERRQKAPSLCRLQRLSQEMFPRGRLCKRVPRVLQSHLRV